MEGKRSKKNKLKFFFFLKRRTQQFVWLFNALLSVKELRKEVKIKHAKKKKNQEQLKKQVRVANKQMEGKNVG